MHIDTTITPSPCHPQPGDVYDYDRQVPDVPEMTRLVVTGITPKTDWSDEHVGFELNGQQQMRSRDGFPFFIASLAGCTAIGRVVTGPAVPPLPSES